MPSTTFPPWTACASAASAPATERSGSTNSTSTPIAASQLLEATRVLQHGFDRRIVGTGLVVEEHQVLDAGHLAELDPDDVAGMAPVSLHRGHLGERVHGVEHDEVGVPEKGDEGLGLAAVFELVLGVGGVDQYFAARLKPIAVGISGMALDLGRHAYAAGRIGLAGHELHELDLRG